MERDPTAGIQRIAGEFVFVDSSIEDIRGSFEYKEPTPYLQPGLFDHRKLAAVLDDLLAFSGVIDAPMDDDNENPAGSLKHHLYWTEQYL